MVHLAERRTGHGDSSLLVALTPLNREHVLGSTGSPEAIIGYVDASYLLTTSLLAGGPQWSGGHAPAGNSP